MGQQCSAACKENRLEKAKHAGNDLSKDSPFKLAVMVVSARGLRDTDRFSGPDRFFYCTFKPTGWDDGLVYSTRWINDVVDPCWKEEAEVTDYEFGDALELSVWDADADDQSELLGTARLEAESFDVTGFNGELPLEGDEGSQTAYLKVRVRVAGQRYPDGPPQELKVHIDNPQKKASGIQYDIEDGSTVFVTGLKQGLITEYNEDLKPDRRIALGSFIIKVNGVEGDSNELAEMLKKETSLDLLIRRPMEWRVAICATSEKDFGMEFNKKKIGNSLLITKVCETPKIAGKPRQRRKPVQEWNAANPDQKINAGDRVIAVNGYKGKAAYLLKRMRTEAKSGRFHLTLVRPASLEY